MNEQVLLPNMKYRNKIFIPSSTRIKDYEIINTIKNGDSSTVFLAKDLRHNEMVAIKVVSMMSLKADTQKELFQREINAMYCLKHESIVSLLDFFWDDNYYYIVMEYCKGGNLADYIIKNGPITDETAQIIFKQIVDAVNFCHKNQVAHRDLKPNNILFTDFPNLKISDFGFCGIINDNTMMNTQNNQMPMYKAPECLCKIKYDGKAADLWSMGVVLYVLMTGKSPWNIRNHSILTRQILSASYRIPSTVPKLCADLIAKLLKINPKERLNTSSIYAHQWMKSVCKADIENEDNIKIDELKKTNNKLHMIFKSVTDMLMTNERMVSKGGIVTPFDSYSESETITQSFFRNESVPVFSNSTYPISKSISKNISLKRRKRNTGPIILTFEPIDEI